MASKSRIKGITIQIGGDTTELTKALKQVDDSLKSTSASLKDVNKLLKLDPANVQLLKQKQELLNQSITDTKARLETLREALKQSTDPEQQKLLTREISETESKLKSLEGEARNFGSVFGQVLQAAGDKLQDVGKKLEGTGKDLSLKLTAPLVAIGGVGINYNAQIEQYQAMFTTLTGSAEEADRIIKQLQADAQKSPFDTKSLVEANQYLISAGVDADAAREAILNLGNAVAATGGGSAELNRMAQNLQQIKNTGKATAMDIRQFANAGINIYGLLAEATGKTTEEVKDLDVSYELLVDALSKASEEGGKYYGAMEAQSQTLNGSISAVKESIQQVLGEITEAAMPVIVEVINKVKEIIDWFKTLDDDTKKNILTIGAVVAAIGPALVIIGKVISTVGTVISVIGTLSTFISGTLVPLLAAGGPIIAAIAAVIAIGVLLYKNWDTIIEWGKKLWESIKETWDNIKNAISGAWETVKKDTAEKWNKMKESVSNVADTMATALTNSWDTIKEKTSNVWEGIKQTISDKIEAAKNVVSKVVDTLKNIFNFNWNLPHIKLPHFNVSGSFGWSWDGGIQLPRISVDWYKKAKNQPYQFNSPTVIGVGDTPEVVVGADYFKKMAQGTGSIVNNITVNAEVNSDQDINVLANKIANSIQIAVDRRTVAWR